METRIVFVLALLSGAWAVWAAVTRAFARFRPDGARPSTVGIVLGARATLLQFSATTCGTCPAVARLLASITAEHPGVAHVEVDVATRPDLVRAYGVRRTPTVLLLDAAGQVVSRSSGPVTRREVLAALDAHLVLETR